MREREAKRHNLDGSPARARIPVAGSLGPDSTTSVILALQRQAGNAAVAQMIVQRDGGHTATPVKSTDLDETAQAIIKAAQSGKPKDERARAAVWAIINAYYPSKKDLVTDVAWDSALSGLKTHSVGKGTKWKAKIEVGEYFIDHTTGKTDFARRVLQVGHELEHIEQHNSGLGGNEHYHEREFLAFYHEGIAPAIAGTGRMGHATRVDLLDEAIRHYNAFSDKDKKRFADEYKALLKKRAEEQKASHHDPTDPPTEKAKDS
jgi:hypothetical protein